MKYQLDLDGILDFEHGQGLFPDEVVSEIGRQLEKATKGFVKGLVKKYDGPIESYKQMSSMASIAAALGTSVIQKDIQEELGEIGYDRFKYEFFLSSPELENYKYRILFLEHGISGYPVKIVLEQGIADEIFGMENSDYELRYDSADELANVIVNVLNSKKVIKVMQELIYAAQRIIKLDAEIEEQ